jgi:hypothetical protein
MRRIGFRVARESEARLRDSARFARFEAAIRAAASA